MLLTAIVIIVGLTAAISIWWTRWAFASSALRRAVRTMRVPNLVAQKLRGEHKSNSDSYSAKVNPPNLSDWMTIDKASILDGISVGYAHWLTAKAATLLSEELSAALAAHMHGSAALFSSQIEAFAKAGAEVGGFLHHLIDPKLWEWFTSVGGLDFAHLLSHKVAVLESGGTLDFGLDSAGSIVTPTFPWVTAVVSSIREFRLMHDGDTTLGRALGHIALDVGFVSGGAAAGATAGSGLAALLIMLDIGLTGGMVTAITALGGVLGAFLGAKASQKMKALAFEDACETFAKAAADYTAAAEMAEQAAVGATTDVTQSAAGVFNAEFSALSDAFEHYQTSILEEETQELQRMAGDVPALLRDAANALRAKAQTVADEQERLGWRRLSPFGVGPQLKAKVALYQRAAHTMQELAAAAAAVHGADLESLWPLLVKAASLDYEDVVCPRLAEFFTRATLREERLRTKLKDAQGRADQLVADVDRLLDQAIIRIREAYAATVEPHLRRSQECWLDVEKEARALGRKAT